jgi:hypothetical protein
MVSSGLLRRVALVRTNVSEESGASFIRVTKIGELGTTQAATSNRRTLRRNFSSETSVLTSVTRHNILEDAIIYSHRRGNLKAYIFQSSSFTQYSAASSIFLRISSSYKQSFSTLYVHSEWGSLARRPIGLLLPSLSKADQFLIDFAGQLVILEENGLQSPKCPVPLMDSGLAFISMALLQLFSGILRRKNQCRHFAMERSQDVQMNSFSTLLTSLQFW